MPGVKDVRVKGAIGVVEMERIDNLDALRARFVEEGVFIRPFGNIIYLTPAFTIASDELKTLTNAVVKVVRSMKNLRERHGAYSGPVIDTHHHIWLRKDVAWLADPPIPRMFGDYFGLRRDYPVEEWINDIVPQGVTKSVHVTAMWGPARELDETRWLQSVADKHGFPHGIVCNANLADANIDAALKAQKQFPNLRGVRQMLYWDTDPMRQAASRADYCNDPDFRRGFALLEKHDLHFELQVYAGQAKYAVELIKAFPECAHDPGARRHADRAHAGSDRRMARGARRRWPRSPICM